VERNWLNDQTGYLEIGPDIPTTIVNSAVEINDEERITEILRVVKSQHESHCIDIFAILDLLWEVGDISNATLLAWESIRAEVREQRYKDALEISAWVSSRLEVILKRSDLRATVIDLVLTFNTLDYIFKKYHVETVKALELIQESCWHLGDERRLALVLLHLGRRYVAFNQTEKSFEYYRNGFEIVERLGDRDIEGQAAPFYAFYYSCQGLHKKALTLFEQIGYPDLRDADSVPDPQIIVTAGVLAAMSGEFHIAIGSLNARWRRAVLADDSRLANFYRAFLGQVLLMNGILEEAILHLDATLKEIDPQKDAILNFIVLRAKAYYLFQKGRIRESYEMLRDAVEESFQQGWHRFYYGFPWVLEMLYYYHRVGYPPIPAYEYQIEIDSALASPSIQSRAVALRLRADEASKAGKSSEVVEDLLLASEKYLLESGNPAELAKTRVQLALLHNRQGDLTRARQFARQAWEARHSLGGQQLPEEIRLLVGGTAGTAPEMFNDRDILIRFLDMMDTWMPSDDRQELFHHIISTTTRFFRAERGAIFLLKGSPEKQDLSFYQGCNFTLEDAKEGDLRSYHPQAFIVIKNNRPMIIREPVAGSVLQLPDVKSVLCIPFSISDEERGILYYDTLHIERAFDWFDNVTLSKITESIRTYFHRIWEFAQRLNRHQSLAVPRARELSEQESGVFVTSGGLFQQVIQRTDRASLSDAPVLILGETGVGKEVIAKRVHLMSKRRDMPFIAVNLASIPEALIESELFGHEKGAFTGADRQKLGRMELANKGTLFIDEVGDIPKFVQVKLLRVLEEMSFVRIGGVVKRDVDFRLIAATNRDLTQEVEAGNFRADLFYRLNVIPIFIPPLRERGDDVIELAQKFLEKSAKKYRLPIQPLSAEAEEWLKAYHWPGNVRELRNVMERAVILNIDPARPTNPMLDIFPTPYPEGHFSADRPTLDEIQRRYITRVLDETSHSVAQAAVILGMKRTTLYKRMQKLGLR